MRRLSLGKMRFENFRIEIGPVDYFSSRDVGILRASLTFTAVDANDPKNRELAVVRSETTFDPRIPEHAREVMLRSMIVRALTHEVEEWLRDDATGERVFEPHPESKALDGLKTDPDSSP